jgi:oligosaccharide repeat unit polymerase
LTIPQIISLTLITFIILISFRKGADLLSPAKVFIFVWSICILLVEFKFSGYQHQWSAFSWFVLLSGLISFLLGIFIAYSLKSNAKLLHINEIRDKIKLNNDFDKQRLFIVILLLFLAYITSLILEFVIEGYIPLFHPRPDRARIDFSVFGLHLFVSQLPSILLLIVEYFVLGSESKKKTIIAISIFLITFFSYFLILQRFNYVYWLVMSIAVLYYASKKINFKNAFIFLIFFVSTLSIITSIRLSQYAAQYLHVVSKMKYTSEYASFTGPYMYIVMNLENLSTAVDKLEVHTYSVMTFDWLYALVGLKHWIKDYFHIIPRPYLVSSYNTYPFMWEYFYDFGILGVCLISLISGLLIGSLYYYMRIKGSLDGVVYYGICLFFIMISFFTNPITFLNTISNMFVLLVVHKFFIYKPKSINYS